jgi:hypothetical protein
VQSLAQSTPLCRQALWDDLRTTIKVKSDVQESFAFRKEKIHALFG